MRVHIECPTLLHYIEPILKTRAPPRVFALAANGAVHLGRVAFLWRGDIVSTNLQIFRVYLQPSKCYYLRHLNDSLINYGFVLVCKVFPEREGRGRFSVDIVTLDKRDAPLSASLVPLDPPQTEIYFLLRTSRAVWGPSQCGT